MKAMYRVMNYCLNTPNRGKFMKPNVHCDLKDIDKHKFHLEGFSDSDYAKDPHKRRSVSGTCMFLDGCIIHSRSKMQAITTLSVTESELCAATECGQDLMFAKNLLESIGLAVREPMILNIDNTGCIALINNWSAGGRTRHMETRMYWLRELRETEPTPILKPRYCPTEHNVSDTKTKNVDGKTFERLIPALVGVDEYLGKVVLDKLSSSPSKEDVKVQTEAEEDVGAPVRVHGASSREPEGSHKREAAREPAKAQDT